MTPTEPTFADVERASERIADHIHRTPVFRSATLDAELGLEAFFKCENFQKIGAFKARGALNAVLSLDEAEARRGVVTHSSGNHGQALAYAAAVRGIPSTVAMPDDAPAVKRQAVAAYGARVVLGPRKDRVALAAEQVAETGGVMVHPYNDPFVVAGQGTAALELLEEVPGLDAVISPVGGGGLMSGTALAVRRHSRDIRLIGAEPETADNSQRSLAAGRLLPARPDPDTIADGLLSGPGPLSFTIMKEAGVEIQPVTDDEIIAAAEFHLYRMKLVVEPSGATGLAALHKRAGELRGLRVGIIISGGNTDFSWLRRVPD